MNKESILGIVKQKQGAALLTVLVFFFTLLTIVVAIIMLTSINFRSTNNSASFASSFYVAEAGLNEFAEVLDSIADSNSKFKCSSEVLNILINELENKVNNSELTYQLVYDSNGNTNGVNIDYGIVMGSSASADVILKEVENNYILMSIGKLGDSTRTLSRTLEFSKDENVDPNPTPSPNPDSNIEDTIFEKGSIIAIDFTGLDGAKFGNGTTLPSVTGPVITNREFHPVNRAEINSAFVTNKPISMRVGLNLQGVLISSSEVLINTSGDETFLNTVVLKRGGSIYIDIAYATALSNINFVLIPEEYKNNLDEVIRFKPDSDKNNPNNSGAYERIVEKVIFYKQDDFDPWDFDYYSSESIYPISESDLTTIFGVHPDVDSNAVDYRTFFKTDFILDNLDNETIVNQVNPKLYLPTFPVASKENGYNQTGEDIRFLSPNSNDYWQDWHTVITVDNIFNYNHTIASNTSFRELDFSAGTETVYSFKSFSVSVPDSLSGDTLVLNVGSKDVKIITESLNINSATLKIIGSGTVSFYVTGSDGFVRPNDLRLDIVGIDINGQGLDKSLEDSTKMKVFVGESRGNDNSQLELTIGNGQNLAITIYSENLNVVFNVAFQGSFITLNGDSVKKSSAGFDMDATLIYAPNALYNNVGGRTVGKFIVKNIEAGQWGSISFQKNISSEVLDSILDPLFGNDASIRNTTARTVCGPNDSLDIQLIWGPTIEVGRSN